jgi:hypothetical protein
LPGKRAASGDAAANVPGAADRNQEWEDKDQIHRPGVCLWARVGRKGHAAKRCKEAMNGPAVRILVGSRERAKGGVRIVVNNFQGVRMSKFASTFKKEFLELIPPTIFFFVALHIVALVRALMTKGTGLPPLSTMSIAVAALILGKAVLLADMFPFINRFPQKPLIYNVVWKTIIYLVVSGVIHYLERLYDYWKAAGSFVAGNEKLLAEMVWPHFIAIQVLLLVLILMYCTMHELTRVIGEDKVRRIFFGPMPAPTV